MLAGYVSALGGDAMFVAGSYRIGRTSLSMIPRWFQAMQHTAKVAAGVPLLA